MAGERILVVEDEENVLNLLEIELTKPGYAVIKAANGQEAIGKAKKERPDLVLMDILLPDINGAEVVRLLKADAATRDVPVLFLTALLGKKEEQECHLGLHIDGHWYRAVAKPFNDGELFREIRLAMSREE